MLTRSIARGETAARQRMSPLERNPRAQTLGSGISRCRPFAIGMVARRALRAETAAAQAPT